MDKKQPSFRQRYEGNNPSVKKHFLLWIKTTMIFRRGMKEIIRWLKSTFSGGSKQASWCERWAHDEDDSRLWRFVAAAAVTDGHCGSRTSSRSVCALKVERAYYGRCCREKSGDIKNYPWPDLCGVAKGRESSRGKEGALPNFFLSVSFVIAFACYSRTWTEEEIQQ